MVRLQWTGLTVKALQTRLQQAYAAGNKQLVRRLSVLLAVGPFKASIDEVAKQWGISPATIYGWIKQFLVERLASLSYHRGPGRKPKLTEAQKKRLCELLDAGPEACGFSVGCWTSVLVTELIQREFGVCYSRYYVCTLLRNLKYSYQKAQFVSDHLDPITRQKWLEEVWPQIIEEARRKKAKIYFSDEASFAQWGSLGYTWSKQGQPPQVQTSGKRKGYKVFGAIEFFSGKLLYQGIEERFDSESYQEFLRFVMRRTKGHIIWIQDGARYHTSASTRQFFEEHQDRITVWQLPGYSPDYNPIEYLWRNTKRAATHNKYFAQFEDLIAAVEKGLADLAADAKNILGLFGRYSQDKGVLPQPLKMAA